MSWIPFGWLPRFLGLRRWYRKTAQASRRPWVVLGLERFEERVVMSASITEFPFAGTASISAGADGNIWGVANGNALYKISTLGTTGQYSSSKSLSFVVAGPDGNLWARSRGGTVRDNDLSQFTTSGGETDFLLPGYITGGGADGFPHGYGVGPVAVGPDSNLWFMGSSKTGPLLSKMDTSGNETDYSIPSAGAGIGYLVASGTYIWFTEPGTNKIGRATTSGSISEFTIPTANSGVNQITADGNGDIWFTESSANQIGEITPSGSITEYAVPTANSGPIGIVSGPDGNLYFTEATANQVDSISTSGVFGTPIAVPTANSYPGQIIVGPDNLLWFAEQGAGQIARINSTGAATTAVTLASSASTSTYGSAVTFTATVAATPTSAGTPTGSVQFQIDGANFGSPVTLSNGAATLTTTALLAGSHAVTAQYTSDNSNQFGNSPLSAALTQVVNPKALTVVANSKTKAYGATVPTLNGTLSGVVSGDNITATYTTLATSGSDVTANGYAITPVLNDPSNRLVNYTVSSTNGTLTITPAGQNITWGTPASISYGTPLSATQLDASVAGTGPAPAGALSYAQAIGAVLAAGSETLTVTAAATQDYSATSDSVTLVVTQPPTVTQLQSSASSASGFGQPVTFTASVTAAAGSPTGTVSFFDAGAFLGTVALTNGTAALTIASLTSGSHAITASYSGDANFNGSTSGVVNQQVNGTGTALFDPSAQFSVASNSNGPWNYGYESVLGDDAAFTPYAFSGSSQGIDNWNGQLAPGGATPQVSHNHTAAAVQVGTATWQPGELALEPGYAGQYSLVSFVVPTGGTYALRASFFAGDSQPGGSDVHVLLDGTALFDGSTTNGSAAFDSPLLTLVAGDRLDFAVGAGSAGNYAHDLTGLQVTIATAQDLGPSAAAAADNVVENVPLTVIATNGVLAGATDPVGLALSATLVSGPAHGAVQLGQDGSFIYTPNTGFIGTDTFTFAASDGSNVSAAATVTLTVADAPPVLSPIADQANAEGDHVHLAVSASDPAGNALTYSAANLPAGLAINNQGVIAGTIAYTAAETSGGDYPVTVTVADGQGGSTSQTFNWTVSHTNPPPVISTIANQANAEGDSVSLAVNATDPDGFPLQYALAGAPAGLQITTGGTIAGTIAYTAAETQGGNYAVTVTATDSQGGSTSQVFTWTVSHTVRPPVFAAVANQSNTELDNVSLPVVPTNPDGFPLQYTLIGAPAGLQITTAGVITGTITVGAAQTDGGNYAVTVVAADSYGDSAATTFGWTVISYAPPALSIASVSQDATDPNTDFAFTVTLSKPCPDVVTVNYSTQDDSATAAAGNYTPVSGALTFNPGETTQTIDVSVAGSADYAPPMDFFVVLSNAANASLAASQGIGTMLHSAPTVANITTAWSDSPDGPVPTFTAAVSINPDVSGPGSNAVPTGTVQFLVNGVNFGTPVTLSNGTASLTVPGTTPGNFTVAAQYVSADATQFTSSNSAVEPGNAGPNVFYDDFSSGMADLANYPASMNMDGTLPAEYVESWHEISIHGDAFWFTNTQGFSYFYGGFGHTFNKNELANDYIASITLTDEAPHTNLNGGDTDWGRTEMVGAPGVSVSNTIGATGESLPGGDTEVLVFTRIGSTTTVTDDGAVVGTYDNTSVVGNSIGVFSGAGNSFMNLAVSDFSVIPLLHDDSYVAMHDQIFQVSAYQGVLTNDSGCVPGQTTLSVVGAPAHGQLELLNDGSFYYLPDSGFVGTDSFVYQVNGGGTATATIDVVDNAPVASDFAVATPVPYNGDLTVSRSVLLDASDYNNDNLTAQLVSGPAHGSLVLETDGTFTYRANPGYSGPDSFTYQANDGAEDSNTATVSLTVSADQAPSVPGASFTTVHDQVLTVDSAAGLLANASDSDPNALLTAEVDSVPSHGTLNLAASGAFQYTPNSGFYGQDQFTFDVSDGTLTSASATVTINVTETAPTGANASFSVLHDHSLVVGIDQGLVQLGSDSDGDPLTAQRVAGPTHGTLTLYGQGAFRYQPVAGYSGPDSFTYQLSDGVLSSPTYTVNLAVTDQAPTATANSYSVDQGHELVTNLWNGVLTGAADADGDQLTAQLVSGPSNGSLTFNPDGSFLYTPRAGFSGTDTFSYQAFDGSLASSPATATITVTPAQAASIPVGQNENYQLLHDTILTVPAWEGVLANDTGSNTLTDGPLQATLVQSTSHGTLTLNAGGSFQYIPNVGLAGTDSFTYQVRNSQNVGNISTVTLNVTDAAPVVPPSSFSVDHDTTLTLAPSQGVLAGASDADGDPITATLLSGPSHGTLIFHADGSFTYTPNTGYVGSDGFTIQGSDGILSTGPVAVSLAVTDTAPSASAAAYQAIAGTSLVVPWYRGLLSHATDADGDPLTAAVVSGPSDGTLTVNVDGSFTYTAGTGFTGSEAFTYRVNDGALNSSPATVTLTVTAPASGGVPVPTFTGLPGDVQAPAVVDATYSLPHDTSLAMLGSGAGLLARASDPQGFPLLAYLVTDVSHGSLAFLADGTFVYQPDLGFVGSDSFTYAASDGPADSAPATVTLNVTAAVPVAGAESYTVHAGTPLAVLRAAGLLASASDADGAFLTASIQSGPQHGALIANPDGSFRYLPDAGFVGTDSFTYEASDGLVSSAPATVTLDVTDSMPVAASATYSVLHDTMLITSEAPAGIMLAGTSDTTQRGLLASSTDSAGDFLSTALVSGTSHGTLVLAANGAFHYLPNAGYVGTDSFTYTVSDGTLTSAPGTVTLNVTDTAPTVTAPVYSTLHDTPLLVGTDTGLLSSAVDADGDALTASVTSQPADGTLTAYADGSFEYVPSAGYAGDDSFTFVVSDGALSTAPVTALIHVTDTPPTATAMSFNLPHDTPLLIDASAGLLSGVTNPDGDPLTLVNVTNPSNGTLVWKADGAFYYQPNPHYAGDDSFTYAVSDGATTTAPVTVTLDVQESAPVAQNTSYTVLHDQELGVTAGSDPSNPGLLDNATNADGDPLTIQLVSTTAHGTLDLKADGGFLYTPDAGFVGTDSFTYDLSDGVTTSNIATATIAVTETPPVASDYSFTVQRNGELSVPTSGAGLLSNASDADSDPLTASLASGPSNGLVRLGPEGIFLYTPDAGFAGTDSFTYDVSDGIADSQGMVTIAVTADPPQISGNLGYDVSSGATLTIGGPGLLAFATDPDGAPLTAALASGASNGSITVNADGSFSYTPDAGYTGGDSFTFTVSDGAASASAVVNLNVIDDPLADQETQARATRDAAVAAANAQLAATSASADQQRVIAQFNDAAGYAATDQQQNQQEQAIFTSAEDQLLQATVNGQAGDDSSQLSAWQQAVSLQQQADIAEWSHVADADDSYLATSNAADQQLVSDDVSADSAWLSTEAGADASLQSQTASALSAQQTLAAQAEDQFNAAALQAQASQLTAQSTADQAEQQAWQQASQQQTTALTGAQSAYQQQLALAQSGLESSQSGTESNYQSALATALGAKTQALASAQSTYDATVQEAQAYYGTDPAALPDLSNNTGYQNALTQAQSAFDAAVNGALTQYAGTLATASATRSGQEQSAQDDYDGAAALAGRTRDQATQTAATAYQSALLGAQITHDQAVASVQAAYRGALSSADTARQQILGVANYNYDTATIGAAIALANAVTSAQAQSDQAEQVLATQYAATTSGADNAYENTVASDETDYEGAVATATQQDAQTVTSNQSNYETAWRSALNGFNSTLFMAQANCDAVSSNANYQYQLALNNGQVAYDLAVAQDEATYENNLGPVVSTYDNGVLLAYMQGEAGFAEADLQALDTELAIRSASEPLASVEIAVNAALKTLAEQQVQAETTYHQALDSRVQTFLGQLGGLTDAETGAMNQDQTTLANQVAAAIQAVSQNIASALSAFDQSANAASVTYGNQISFANSTAAQGLQSASQAYISSLIHVGRDSDLADEAAQVIFQRTMSLAATDHDNGEAEAGKTEVLALAAAVGSDTESLTDAWASWSKDSFSAQGAYQAAWAQAEGDKLAGLAQANAAWQASQVQAGAQNTAALDLALAGYQNALVQAAAAREQAVGNAGSVYSGDAAAAWEQWLIGNAGYAVAAASELSAAAQDQAATVGAWAEAQGTLEADLLAAETQAQATLQASAAGAQAAFLQAFGLAVTDRVGAASAASSEWIPAITQGIVALLQTHNSSLAEADGALAVADADRLAAYINGQGAFTAGLDQAAAGRAGTLAGGEQAEGEAVAQDIDDWVHTSTIAGETDTTQEMSALTHWVGVVVGAAQADENSVNVQEQAWLTTTENLNVNFSDQSGNIDTTADGAELTAWADMQNSFAMAQSSASGALDGARQVLAANLQARAQAELTAVTAAFNTEFSAVIDANLAYNTQLIALKAQADVQSDAAAAVAAANTPPVNVNLNSDFALPTLYQRLSGAAEESLSWVPGAAGAVGAALSLSQASESSDSTVGVPLTADIGNHLCAVSGDIETLLNAPKGIANELQFLAGCFAAGTPMLTPGGSKPIDQFKPDDLILARSPLDPTGRLQAKLVEEVFVRTAKIVNLHIAGRVVQTTAEHPFWARGKGWLPAVLLQLGDELSSHDGRWFAVEDLLDTDEFKTVYNVRVADWHTYFVGSHDWGFSIWAHNYGGSETPPAENVTKDALERQYWILTAKADELVIRNISLKGTLSRLVNEFLGPVNGENDPALSGLRNAIKETSDQLDAIKAQLKSLAAQIEALKQAGAANPEVATDITQFDSSRVRDWPASSGNGESIAQNAEQFESLVKQMSVHVAIVVVDLTTAFGMPEKELITLLGTLGYRVVTKGGKAIVMQGTRALSLGQLKGAIGDFLINLGNTALFRKVELRRGLAKAGQLAGDKFHMTAEEVKFATRLLQEGADVRRAAQGANLGDFIVVHNGKVYAVELTEGTKTTKQLQDIATTLGRDIETFTASTQEALKRILGK